MQALHFLKILLNTPKLVLKFRHLLFTYCLSVLAKNVDYAQFYASSSLNEVFVLMGYHTALIGISLDSYLGTTNQCCIKSSKSKALKHVDCSHKDLAVSPTNNNHTNQNIKIIGCHTCTSYCFLKHQFQDRIIHSWEVITVLRHLFSLRFTISYR